MKDLHAERYILAHEAYKKALWSRDNRPVCFEDSDDAIVLQHNKDVGAAFAAFQRDLNVQYEEVIRMAKAANLRENRLEKLEAKCKQLQNKVRELSTKEKNEQHHQEKMPTLQ